MPVEGIDTVIGIGIRRLIVGIHGFPLNERGAVQRVQLVAAGAHRGSSAGRAERRKTEQRSLLSGPRDCKARWRGELTWPI